jgi:hypothetical protein
MVMLSFSAFSQNKIDDIKKELQRQKGIEQNLDKQNTSSCNTYDSSYSDDNIFVALFFEIGVSITYGILFETFWEKDLPMHDAHFTQYPYFDNHSGNYTYENRKDYVPFKLVLSGNMFAENNKLYGNYFEAKMKFLDRVDLTSSFSSITEANSAMTIYDAMFHFHRIRMPKLDIWYGLGVMHLGKDIEQTAFSLDFGGEWFVKKPISVSAQWQYGYFDNFYVRKNTFLAKYHIQNFSISFGAVNYKFDDTSINTLNLGLNVYL